MHPTLAKIQAQLPARLDYWKQSHTAEIVDAAKTLGAETIRLNSHGFKLNVTVLDNVIVSITHNRMSARGDYYLKWATDGTVSFANGGDPCGPSKFRQAVEYVITCWKASDATQHDLTAFYAAMGKSGFCCCCGANLTDPVSTTIGIGPKCRKSIFSPSQIDVMLARIAASA